MSLYSPFFDFAKKRHQITLDRKAGKPWPWTDDPILQRYKFTNVFRELDRTTVWFVDHVRDPYRNSPEVLLATVVFRWFNRITTGEAIFCQNNTDGRTAWETFIESNDCEDLRSAVLSYCGDGPYVTGAYIIKTPDGFTKLSGVLKSCEWFTRSTPDFQGKPTHWLDLANQLLQTDEVTLEAIWKWLKLHPFLGDFMAYEIVSDLRWTGLLDKAPDIMTWANPGPGAMRGLNRIHDRKLTGKVSKNQANEEMQEILKASTELFNEEYPDWPWEMREVEHTLCEFDKYQRMLLGEGKMKGTYTYAG